jgi:GcrA cell cycle regulator
MEQGVMAAQWDDAHAEHLQALAKMGLSASLIARALNEKFGTSYSRNAVIGRMSRESVESRPLKQRYVRIKPPRIKPPMNVIHENAPHKCSLLSLTNNSCRWPLGSIFAPVEFFCGGGAVEGKPYCAEHCRVAYRDRTA